MEPTRCEHLEAMGTGHAHILRVNGVEHHLCHRCYQNLLAALVPDKALERYGAPPLTEPDIPWSVKWGSLPDTQPF